MSTTDIVFESQQLFSTQFEALLNNPLLSDVTFVVGQDKTQIFAHKIVLAARSPVFRGMFETVMKESKQKEFFIDSSYQSFYSILNYIYSGKIKVEAEFLPEVLNLANYYDLEILRKSCSERLEKGLNASNVCSVLSLASLYKESTLKKQALKYIMENTDKVLENENFGCLPEPVLIKLLKKNDVLIASEEKIFQAVVSWGKSQIIIENEDNISDSESLGKGTSDNETDGDEYQDKLREVLQEVFQEVRFPLMTPEFLKTVESTKLVEPALLEQAKEYKTKGTTSMVNWRRFEARKSSHKREQNTNKLFDFLVNYPQFTMIKDMIKQNPKLLDPVLAELKKGNPELANLIADNRQEFILLFQ